MTDTAKKSRNSKGVVENFGEVFISELCRIKHKKQVLVVESCGSSSIQGTTSASGQRSTVNPDENASIAINERHNIMAQTDTTIPLESNAVIRTENMVVTNIQTDSNTMGIYRSGTALVPARENPKNEPKEKKKEKNRKWQRLFRSQLNAMTIEGFHAKEEELWNEFLFERIENQPVIPKSSLLFVNTLKSIFQMQLN